VSLKNKKQENIRYNDKSGQNTHTKQDQEELERITLISVRHLDSQSGVAEETHLEM
jgi:hypothetical protein